MKTLRIYRFIRTRSVERLSENSMTGQTDHSHENLEFLDELTIDTNRRLKYGNELIAVPLHQEDW